ncbi:Glycerophosphocholine phosphodiesterase [Clydaea vesicula]|uniref:Glycerophosphocholine phosphodiesterase n=1 Tax=Clydaea vesicula TaxID=447962 RepID=A0AAD5TVH0_9FUNG|nr:Glycerophosphocholine phosphodiesterase [Clydaea vesicula]KAJ3388047.1 Glycerophosphocholine phosphodiesterase [Lobulomyces angularis]
MAVKKVLQKFDLYFGKFSDNFDEVTAEAISKNMQTAESLQIKLKDSSLRLQNYILKQRKLTDFQANIELEQILKSDDKIQLKQFLEDLLESNTTPEEESTFDFFKFLILNLILKFNSIQCLNLIFNDPAWINILNFKPKISNYTVLHRLASHTLTSNEKVIEKLLSLKDWNTDFFESKDILGNTPLLYTISKHKESSFKNSFQILDHFLKVQLPVTFFDEDVITSAIYNGNAKALEKMLFLDNGEPRKDSFFSNGNFNQAVRFACSKGYDDVVEICIKRCDALRIDFDECNKNYSFLHLACRYGNYKCIEMLLKKINTDNMLSVNHSGIYGYTPLIYAAIFGDALIINLLLSNGANIEQADVFGWRAVEHAIYRGHLQLKTLLTPERSFEAPSFNFLLASLKCNELLTSTTTTTVILYKGSIDHRKNLPFYKLHEKNIPEHLRAPSYSISFRIESPSCGIKSEVLTVDLRNGNPNKPQVAIPFVFKFDIFKQSSIEDLVLFVQLKTSLADSILGSGLIEMTNGTSLWKERSSFGGTFKGKIFYLNAEGFSVILEVFFDVTIIFNKYDPMEYTKKPEFHGTRIIGHRGLGKDLPLINGKQVLELGENTITSFLTAGRLGADLVEFDVQLTNDFTPVIYHDWTMGKKGNNFPVHSVSLRNFLSSHPDINPALGSLFNETIQRSPVGRLSRREQLGDNRFGECSLGIEIEERGRNRTRGLPVSRTLSEITEFRLKFSSFENEKWPSKGNYDGTIQEAYPTLEDMFKKIPKNIGFNVEIKYPKVDEAEKDNLCMSELNFYLDTILNVTQNNLLVEPNMIPSDTTEREIFFSTFHPDSALGIRLKQKKHSVFFLTDGGIDISPDHRCNSLRQALKFCQLWNLQGIVTNVDAIIGNSMPIIKKFNNNGLKVSSYGFKNNDVQHCKEQVDSGINNIICDSVNKIKSGLS